MTAELTFDSIAEAGRAIVDAHKKKKGFEEGIRRLLSELYPDNAHFIYELLQNAEDAAATVVEFDLREEALEMRHNGSRLFTLKDIDSITNIGDSTKKDDPTQIGKFGVGFKAVYSYTNRPEIRSGGYSFAIEDLFVNERIEGSARAGWSSFRFPFDREEKPANTARAEIARGLGELDEGTLLFLNSIKSVSYALPDKVVGICEREEHGLTITIQKNECDDFVESHWLRLVGPASVPHDGPHPLSVAVAFKLVDRGAATPKSGKGSSSDEAGARTRAISPLGERKGDVSIYFPAAKEDSGLRFHIHAPFASTVARDSVRDDPGNVQLIEDIATLIVSHLPALRDQGLLDESLLATLPNNEDALEQPYSLIRDRVIEAFNENSITPVVGGRAFAPASSLVASPAEFRGALAEADLATLLDLADVYTGAEPRWVRPFEGRAGRFLAGLDTIEFGWFQLAHLLENLEHQESAYGNYVVCTPSPEVLSKWINWLAAKPESELLDLYQLIGRGLSEGKLHGVDWLKTVPVIRLVRRGSIEHVKGPETHLPEHRGDNNQSRVPVGLAYFDDETGARAMHLRAFYRAAGVSRWSETARIEARLKVYQDPARKVPKSNEDVARHLDDVRAFAGFALTNPGSATNLFTAVPFLLSLHPDGSMHWVAPKDTYLDLPFTPTGFAALYKWHEEEWGKNDEVCIWDDPERYAPAGIYLEVQEINAFLQLVGSATRIEVVGAQVFRNHLLKREWWIHNRHSPYTVVSDWDIENFEGILETGDTALLRTLWYTIVESPAPKAVAVYQANRSAQRYLFDSQLVQRLKATPWILDLHGDLKLPREVALDDLREDWKRPGGDSLAHKLDFGADAAQRRQKADGVTAYLRDQGLESDGIDVLREAKEAGVSMAELSAFIKEEAAADRFPDGASDDPDRRSAIAQQDAADAPEYLTETRQRSVVDGQALASAESKGYLRGQYTTDGGEMFCQACRKPLPFRVNGEWYFEAVHFVTRRRQVHAANALALCPLCAALYKHKRETANDALMQALLGISIEKGQGSVEVPVLLNERRVQIRFTGKHALDLQAVLQPAGTERT